MSNSTSTQSNSNPNGARWVEISFDCVPLRTIARTDIPLDASPKLAAKMMRVKAAIEKHGTLNSYYLHNATCSFHFTNDPLHGMVQFSFEGVVMTDTNDLEARSADLKVELARETCGWINQTIVDWLNATVPQAVRRKRSGNQTMVEFNRYMREEQDERRAIEAGDLTVLRQSATGRMESIQVKELPAMMARGRLRRNVLVTSARCATWFNAARSRLVGLDINLYVDQLWDVDR